MILWSYIISVFFPHQMLVPLFFSIFLKNQFENKIILELFKVPLPAFHSNSFECFYKNKNYPVLKLFKESPELKIWSWDWSGSSVEYIPSIHKALDTISILLREEKLNVFPLALRIFFTWLRNLWFENLWWDLIAL